jgi:hypothetical protein
MYIGVRLGAPQESQGYRESMEQTERSLHEEYVRACPPGMRIVRTLRRSGGSLREEIAFLERRLRLIPSLFRLLREEQAAIRSDPFSNKPQRYEVVRLRVQRRYVDPYFGHGYALTTESDELAKTGCELSRARWRFIASVRHGTVPGGGRRRAR